LYSIANVYETTARKNWSVIDFKLEVKIPALPELKTNTVSRSSLTNRLSAAAGPSFINEVGTNVKAEKPNEYWPDNNEHWSGQFGRIATEGIANSIDAVAKANNKEVGTFLAQYIDALKSYLESLGQSVVNKSNSLDLRSQLLWVKESQYSLCMNTSYRDIETAVLPFVISKDITDIIPAIYPVSVDFFAKEIARVSNEKMDLLIPIRDILDSIYQHKELIKPLLVFGTEMQNGRQGLCQFIVAMINEQVTITNLYAMTGITEDIAISHSDILIWLIQSYQTKQLTSFK
jgi:hypothetical protein